MGKEMQGYIDTATTALVTGITDALSSLTHSVLSAVDVVTRTGCLSLNNIGGESGTVAAHVSGVAHALPLQTHTTSAIDVVDAFASSVDVVAAGGSDENVLVQTHRAVGTQPVAVADALVFDAQAPPIALIVT